MRHGIFVGLLILFLSLLLFSCSDEARDDSDYVFGKTGPAGGYIFYDCDADNDSGNADGLISSECGWRYLEAAPANLKVIGGTPSIDMTQEGYPEAPEVFIFGYYRPEAGSTHLVGTAPEIGKGSANTTALYDAMGDAAYYAVDGFGTTQNYAAKLCKTLSYKGFNDWFLPSKEELDLMYEKKDAIGGFEAYSYWSSSEDGSYPADRAFERDFESGEPYGNVKSGPFCIRPIRAFK